MMRIALVFAVAAAAVGYNATSALAVTPGWECIPTTAGQPVVSGGTGSAPSCGIGTTPVLAPTYISSGVGGKPTVQFSTLNVQVVSGTGSTDTNNGTGNLVVGYAENSKNFSRTGSNNLIVGTDNGWTSNGGIVGGSGNMLSGAEAVLFGEFNKANSAASFIGGGCGNFTGSGKAAKRKCPANGVQAILGGRFNQATGAQAAVSGGQYNLATDLFASIAGGCDNIAGAGTALTATCTAGAQAILGGFQNTATGLESTVSGGEVGFASGGASSVAGGQFNSASGGGASVAGGDENTAAGDFSSVLGGFFNSESTRCASIPASPGSC